jgi:hypothetical protein
MISRETVEQFAKTQNDALVREGVRSTHWERCSQQDAYLRSVREAFRSIGVKVEGDE